MREYSSIGKTKEPLAIRLKGDTKMKYKVHQFNLKMTTEQRNLAQFLNSLEGEIVAIIPNVAVSFFWIHRVDFLLIIEKIA